MWPQVPSAQAPERKPPGAFVMPEAAMPHAPRKDCSTPGCHNLVKTGACPTCRAKRDQQRGTSAQRGYDARHRNHFRSDVLQKNGGCCVLCGAWASVADHHPLSRRELEKQGIDPNDPQHGRPLCHTCHSKETAKHQPGGWNVVP